jgi:FkbM family methyltransferase
MNYTANIRTIVKRLLPRKVGDIGLKYITLFLVEIYQRKLKQKIHIRPNTSDINVFAEIFLFKDYHYKLPISPCTIVDAGANVGYASLWFHMQYPEAHIVAIEPEQSNFDLLSLNTNSISNIILIKKGLWSKNTILEITNEDGSKYGFVTKEVSNSNNGIDTCTIDNLIEIFESKGFTTIDILKIDIEGAEKEVFSKNIETWINKVKFLIIELHEDTKPGCTDTVLNIMNQYGYKLFLEKGENLVYLNVNLA